MPTRRAATGPHVLRAMNADAVLAALRAAETPAVSVTALATATGLSRPAVTRALAALAEGGLVESVTAAPEAAAAPGRPAQHVRFRAEAGHVAGIDIGPHKVLVVIADLAGGPRAERRVTVGQDIDGPGLFETVRTALTAAVAEAGIAPADLRAVSVGTPGIVDRERGEILLAPSIPGWAGLPVVPRLREWLHCPVLIDNDVDLAVLGERWRGGSGDADSLVFVQWGERIGAGMLLDGRPFRGAGGAAGELGFIDVRCGEAPGGEVPGGAVGDDVSAAPLTSTLGPFERLAGAAAIRRLAQEAGVALGPEGEIGPLFTAAAAGDPAAAAVVDRAAARFARGLATLVLLLDPGRVVIGGGLSRAGETLLGPVRRHLRDRTLTTAEVTASVLGERAVAVGALRRALDAVEPTLTASA
ncbi:ROK family protein [Kitasatospora sp. NPDC051853]|uniref:ROK family transcriptional regulator n=1 Tax=Kitasatospora sp. NPDC051853 TaxID=3364058 RepID=UPI003798FDBB